MKSLLLYFFLAVTLGYSQTETITMNPRATAYSHIKQLKNGILLVRLQTFEMTIEALRNRNNEEKAQEVAKMISKKNSQIIKAFEENFSFCGVLFFYSGFSDSIRKESYKHINFFGDTNKINQLKTNGFSRVFTADVNYLKGEQNKMFQGYYLQRSASGVKRVPYYLRGPDMGFEALRIMNTDFNQLSRPFPYYERTLSSLPLFGKRMSKIVKAMNENLTHFHEKAVRKSIKSAAKN